MKKIFLSIIVFSFLLILAFKFIKAQALPGQFPTPYPPPYNYSDQYNPYAPPYGAYGQPYGANQPQIFDYTNEQLILQKREYFTRLLSANSASFTPQDSYFFLVGQFSLLLPYLLFSLPQPQISVFSLASVFLMYP